MTNVVVILIFVSTMIQYVWGLQVIPERSNVKWTNEKYVTDSKFYVKRYGRRSIYYINLEGTNKHVWGNNISLHFVFYEYLHNEYKRSFVELHYKLCDMLKYEQYLGQTVAATGIPCPLPPGFHRISNFSVPAAHFPNVWPFERCKVDIKINLLPAEETISNLEIYASFKQ